MFEKNSPATCDFNTFLIHFSASAIVHVETEHMRLHESHAVRISAKQSHVHLCTCLIMTRS